MELMGIDPGYSTGIAFVSTAGELVYSSVVPKDEVEIVYDLIVSRHPSVVIVEDFIGAGPRTREAIFVLKLIGSVVGVCYTARVPVKVQVPQTRLPFEQDAIDAAPKLTSVHVISALAHTLAFMEKETERG